MDRGSGSGSDYNEIFSYFSLLLTLFSAVQIILEDLVIFLVELLDIFSSILEIGSNLADSILQAGSNTVYSIHSGKLNICALHMLHRFCVYLLLTTLQNILTNKQALTLSVSINKCALSFTLFLKTFFFLKLQLLQLTDRGSSWQVGTTAFARWVPWCSKF